MRATASAVLADTFDVTTADDDALPGADNRPIALAVVGTGNAPAGLPTEVPILWLAARRGWAPPANPHRSFVLGRDFVPPELRSAVASILSDPAVRPLTTGGALLHPFLSANAVPIAQEAVRTGLPVLIFGPRGTNRGAIAQAIHRDGGGGPFMVLSARSITPSTVVAAISGTLFIDRIEQLQSEQQDFLLQSLQPDGSFSQQPDQRLRVLAGTEWQVDEILQNTDLSAELFYRLNVLPLALVPLRDRPQDIAPLAQIIAASLAKALGIAAASFTPTALEHLTNYLWFGDVIELEAVLARTLALSRKELIDADDLRFSASDRNDVARHQVASGGPAADNAALHSRALDLVINQIAHELKNPLVTIKTFAQHLRRQGGEGSEEQQLARLTGEAVDEIDQSVENLVQFTRLEEPVRESVALQAVLAPAVALLTQLVRPRTKRVDYRPPPAVSVTVDRAQVIYGLSNLFRALARGLGDTGRIVVGYEDGRIVVELPTGFDPSDAHLAALVGAPQINTPSSLAAAIAQRVLERNGAVLAFETQRQPPRVTVQFPLSPVEEVPLARNVQTPRVGR